jgi:NADH:ubiquinone reductase (H+-translocating)
VSHPHPTPEIAAALAPPAPRGRRPHRVVVVGGGFGGLRAVRGLADGPVEVTLVDRRNFHLFQPLLYQVATGALSAGEIATPLRTILKRQDNARVVMGEVQGIDLEARRLSVGAAGDGAGREIEYDTLVVAAGAGHSYFGHDEWRAAAPGLKSLEDAREIRRRVLLAFEAAEAEDDPARRRAWLTFVVVGAGPTGVELAGQIAEIARETLRRDFRAIDPADARVLLVEAAGRPLTSFHEKLSQSARGALERLGVTVCTGRQVVELDERSVTLSRDDGDPERIGARTTVWAAGVAGSPLAAMLAEASGAPLDRARRIAVEPDLTLPGHPEVFALGDMATVPDGRGGTLPGVAPVAMQQGRFAAAVIRDRLAGRPPAAAFRYRDKGSLATIGRARAVAEFGPVRVAGPLAWLAWLGVHIAYLVGFQNRLLVLTRWTTSFLTRGRGSRLIGREGEPVGATDTSGTAVP